MRQGERRDEPACDPVGDSQDQPADGRGIWSGDVDELVADVQGRHEGGEGISSAFQCWVHGLPAGHSKGR